MTTSVRASKSLVLIAVMGITGSGKSTFISHCTDEVVPIGNHLQSRECSLPLPCLSIGYQTDLFARNQDTQDVTSYRYKFAPKRNVYLIDTPGFDDTTRDDTDVLRNIADWLTLVYEKRIDLRGVIYLHRITDPRMQGSAMKNLFMFRKLCGPEGLKNVILATTMWENVAEGDGNRREVELRATPDYWKTMIEQHGSRMVRHQNDSQSAQKIIDSLLQSTEPITYAIQNEMVDQGKDLDQTSAGKELSSIQAEERERFDRQLESLKKDMAEAKELHNKESQEQIRMLQEEKNRDISRLQKQQEKMRISLEKLHKEKHEELRKLLKRMNSDAEISRAEQEKQRQVIDGLTQRLAMYSLVKRESSVVKKESSDSLGVNIDSTSPRRGGSPRGSRETFPGTQLVSFGDEDDVLREEVNLALCGRYHYFRGPMSTFR